MAHVIKLFIAFLWLYHVPVVLNAQQTTIEGTKADSSTSELEKNNLSYFSNTVLINQHGEKMKFYEDLLKDKIVVINAFYAECVGACSPMHNSIEQVQKHFGDRVGEDIYLISITVDPAHDTLEVLDQYAEKFMATKGWYFLSGDIENVNFVQKKLGQYAENRESHSTILLVGNVKTGLWKKVNGLSPSNDIIGVIESVVNDQE